MIKSYKKCYPKLYQKVQFERIYYCIQSKCIFEMWAHSQCTGKQNTGLNWMKTMWKPASHDWSTWVPVGKQTCRNLTSIVSQRRRGRRKLDFNSWRRFTSHAPLFFWSWARSSRLKICCSNNHSNQAPSCELFRWIYSHGAGSFLKVSQFSQSALWENGGYSFDRKSACVCVEPVWVSVLF